MRGEAAFEVLVGLTVPSGVQSAQKVGSLAATDLRTSKRLTSKRNSQSGECRYEFNPH